MRLKTCKKCNELFEPEKAEDVCPSCIKPKEVVVGNCVIREAYGRCQEHIDGICSKCLMVTAKLDWEGWRRIKWL